MHSIVLIYQEYRTINSVLHNNTVKLMPTCHPPAVHLLLAGGTTEQGNVHHNPHPGFRARMHVAPADVFCEWTKHEIVSRLQTIILAA